MIHTNKSEPTICWTLLKDIQGKRLEEFDGSTDEFVSYLASVKAPDKKSCPLVTLVDFGNKKTSSGSLRSNDNVIAINGVIGDYDDGRIKMEEAQKMLASAGIFSILYPTPSNTLEKPRWRAIAPTSRQMSPTEHKRLTGLLNKALGGILARESFTLSQSYYHGDVGTNDYKVLKIQGKFIDELEPIREFEVPNQETIEQTRTESFLAPSLIADLHRALAHMPADDRDLWQRMGHAIKTIGNAGKELWFEWSSTSSKFDLADAERVWESFKPKNTGYQAVFAEAQRRGWINPNSMGVPGEALNLSDLEKLIVPIDGLASVDIPTPHVIDKLIPCDEVTLLAGHGGSGKSQIALNMAVHIALGLPFAGLETTQANVLFFSGEDGRATLEKRIKNLCLSLSISPNKLKDKLFLLDASDIDPALHREQRVAGVIKLETPLVTSLHNLTEKLRIGFIVIDNASDTFDDDEIKRVRVRAFVRSLRTHLARPNKAVLLLAHVNKQSARGQSSEEDYSGSTAWHNSVRSRLSLIQENKILKLIHQKANYSEKAEPIWLSWTNGVPLVHGSIPEHVAAQKSAIANDRGRDKEAKNILLQILHVFFERGEPVNASLTGAYSSFKTMKSDPTFPDILKSDVDRFKRLMREMQDDGLIIRKTIKTPARRVKEIFVNSAPMSSKFPHIGANNE